MNRCKAGFLAAFFPTRFERFPPLPPALPALVRFTNSPPQHRVSLTRGALINPGLCTSQAAGLRRRLLCPSNTKTTTCAQPISAVDGAQRASRSERAPRPVVPRQNIYDGGPACQPPPNSDACTAAGGRSGWLAAIRERTERDTRAGSGSWAPPTAGCLTYCFVRECPRFLLPAASVAGSGVNL